MKTVTKKNAVIALAATSALALFCGVCAIQGNAVSAEEPTTASVSTAYFYDGLKDESGNEYTLAKKFYDALDDMAKNGDFKDGVVGYSLDGIVSSQELEGWVVNGNLAVPKAFSAARDAYLTDHPEIFYIDFYKLTISVSRNNGVYTGYIDCGREANCYYDNGFNTPDAVENAIERFNAKIDEIVDDVEESQASDVYSAKDVVLAREVNRYLAESIEYDYAAYENREDPNYVASAYINTPYGGLVNNKAVCGGFSTSYKVIMDKLGIPCITVNGQSNNKDESGNSNGASVFHMWNYVYLENPVTEDAQTYSLSRAALDGGRWYSVDVTWNSAASNKNRYSILNKSADENHHVNDGVISSSGYELEYPELSDYNYGSTGETEGLHSSLDYTPEGTDKDDYGSSLQNTYVSVSYNGKSARRLLEEDGLYLAYRAATYFNEDSEQPYSEENGSDVTQGNWVLEWQNWIALDSYREYFEYQFELEPNEGIYQDNGTETRIYGNTSVYYFQFAVFDIKPDVEHRTHQGDGETAIENSFYFEYSSEIVEKNKPIVLGDAQENQTYGTYTPPPYVVYSTPSHWQKQTISDRMRDGSIKDRPICSESNAFTIEVTYDEPLHILDASKDIGISFVSHHPNAKDYAQFFPVNSDGDLVEIIEKEKNSSDSTKELNTLRFKFGPSLMWEHDDEIYTFTFTNVGSAKSVLRRVNNEMVEAVSNKLPNPACFNFARHYMACPARFNYDGRLWVECCAQPTLIANSDLSDMNFTDENGEDIFNSTNQRSQMMLVAERADNQTVDTMLDEISEHNDIAVTKDDIKTSETYDISLSMCGKHATIPDGSYVKIALGFPEGYGPDDEGVTFKLFHRKHVQGDEYIIEEVPCVVTQFGIVATVTSFSPYMVAVVDADKATSRTIYASIEGKGGRLTVEDGKIRSLAEGESYTYTVQPDEGYQVYKVMLNNTDVTDKLVNSKLTLNYSELALNNEVEIQYIATAAAQRLADRGGEIVAPAKALVSTDGEVSVTAPADYIPSEEIVINVPTLPANNAPANNNTLIIGIVIAVACIVVSAAALTATFVILKKHRS